MRAPRLIVIALVALAAAAAGLVVPGSSAQAASKAPVLTGLICVPKTSAACRSGRTPIGRQVQLRGRSLKQGMRVTFRWSLGALAAKLKRTRVGYVTRVPPGTRAGKVSVYVRDAAGRKSNARRLTVGAPPGPAKPIKVEAGPLPEAFRGNGMWIWMLERSNGGDPAAIAARARASGMSTVFIKSADGANDWKQFSPQLVQTLKAAGLRVCAWPFVYGANPAAEARLSAAAVADGADCLVIDAEGQYNGRYAAAQRYMVALRAAVGTDYPLGLSSFPYVDYHPKFPYSVFLGPAGAQANVPQVYWKDIGAKVDGVVARTVAHNRIYKRPIAPLGQAYDNPAPADLTRFRALWTGYGAGGLSWWSWQSASPTTFATIGRADPAPIVSPDPGYPALEKGDRSDEVIWLQQHLASAVPGVKIDGDFGSSTLAAVQAFQSSKGLAPSGETDAATWRMLLEQPIQPVNWAGAG